MFEDFSFSLPATTIIFLMPAMLASLSICLREHRAKITDGDGLGRLGQGSAFGLAFTSCALAENWRRHHRWFGGGRPTPFKIIVGSVVAPDDLQIITGSVAAEAVAAVTAEHGRHRHHHRRRTGHRPSRAEHVCGDGRSTGEPSTRWDDRHSSHNCMVALVCCQHRHRSQALSEVNKPGGCGCRHGPQCRGR